MKLSKVSVIIPVRQRTKYLEETLKCLKKQTYQNFEILVVTDKISNNPNPAFKRNLGVKKSTGLILAFLDDDSYPDPNWLSAAVKQFNLNPKLAGVCGPCLTPPSDSITQQASGLIWATWLGSGGAGTYRNSVKPARFVDDYPSVNLLISKELFLKVGGFNIDHWPGEDTILCLDITQKLNRQILYHPTVVVYHHRRPVIIPHLQQITRYALHRGYFAKKFPQTSFRLGYLIPSLCVLYLITTPLIYPFIHYYALIPYLSYISLLIFTFFQLMHQKENPLAAILAMFSIPITHFYYGLLFISGFLRSNLSFVPHPIDTKSGQYLGG